ncbi:MAG TPA: ABC transporter ATP-binding protein [Candidatus Binatia bacterium]|nr:ABC transporter ATP-binding protein [Candidatus Binatia bacterium]
MRQPETLRQDHRVAPEPYLTVNDLRVKFPTEDGLVSAVDGVSFSVTRGRTLAIVGESGSGKSVTALAIMGLLDRKSAQVSGEVWLDNQELLEMSDAAVRKLRGSKMAMIFQDPMSSLHPFYRVGAQLAEAAMIHRKLTRQQARAEAIEMLARVGIPAPKRRVDDYPHQLSGGMRQRVMIAMALINSPALLIADEPTTALDVTVQAQILDLIGQLQSEFNTAVIIITHDLGIVADVADEVAVMYAARIVERASTETLYGSPEMPYTLGLLASIPRMDRERTDRLDPIPGNPPSPLRHPDGCVFHPRCKYKDRVPGERCFTERPELLESERDHLVRCHLPAEERRSIAREVLSTSVGGGAVAVLGGVDGTTSSAQVAPVGGPA